MSDDLDDLIAYETPAFHLALADARHRHEVLMALHRHRLSIGMSLAEVSNRAELQPGTVQSIDGGTGDPHLSSLMAYARALGLQVQILVAPLP